MAIISDIGSVWEFYSIALAFFWLGCYRDTGIYPDIS
jgi:hypothetical protein